MRSSDVTIAGVKMSLEAARSVECAGVDVAVDLAHLRSGQITRQALLARCLDGSEDADVADWEDYVSSVAAAASSEVST